MKCWQDSWINLVSYEPDYRSFIPGIAVKVINTNTHTHRIQYWGDTDVLSLSGDILETSDLQMKVNKVLDHVYCSLRGRCKIYMSNYCVYFTEIRKDSKQETNKFQFFRFPRLDWLENLVWFSLVLRPTSIDTSWALNRGWPWLFTSLYLPPGCWQWTTNHQASFDRALEMEYWAKLTLCL